MKEVLKIILKINLGMSSRVFYRAGDTCFVLLKEC